MSTWVSTRPSSRATESADVDGWGWTPPSPHRHVPALSREDNLLQRLMQEDTRGSRLTPDFMNEVEVTQPQLLELREWIGVIPPCSVIPLVWCKQCCTDWVAACEIVTVFVDSMMVVRQF